MTPGLKPLDMLTTDALKAKWGNEGLQTDTLSIENGAVLHSASRWPLLIDPQLQVGSASHSPPVRRAGLMVCCTLCVADVACLMLCKPCA